MDAIQEQDIARAAIDAFHEQTGLTLTQDCSEGPEADGLLYLNEADVVLVAWVKKWVAHVPVGVLLDRMARLSEPGKGILLADHVNPELAVKLKAAGVQFLDSAGNAFLRQPPLYVYITGRKPTRPLTTGATTAGRAFQPSGLKVVYAFLSNRELVNGTYREIAGQTGVALGTIGWVIRDLVEQGYLEERGRMRKRDWLRYDALLDKWVEAYPQKLRGKQLLGYFASDREMWWKQVRPEAYGAVWGGEIAAAEYTQYLNPVRATLYIPKMQMGRFLKDERLRKAKAVEIEWPHATVELLEPFWKPGEDHGRLANPVLVYADLIASGDSRNIETAQKLRDQYIGQQPCSDCPGEGYPEDGAQLI
ncbi:MAG: type IV toxin-antitoxin system AbiEi family antitoxin [Pseudohongiellaceae bacterium]